MMWYARARVFDRVRDVLVFAGAAGLAAPIVSSTLGGLALVASGLAAPSEFRTAWVTCGWGTRWAPSSMHPP